MNTISKKVANNDIFGEPITLNFRGSSHFKTTRGGLITIMISIVMLYQISTFIIHLYTQKEPLIQSYESARLPEEPVNLAANK